MPGFWRDRSYHSMRLFCSRIADAGWDTAILDVRGHGSSGGIYTFNLLEHHDVSAVARDALTRAGASSVTLVGFSMGGGISVAAAAERSDLPWQSLFLISPVADFQMLRPRIPLLHLRRHLAFSQALSRPRFPILRFRSERKLAAKDLIGRLTQPIALVHTRNDWLVNHTHSEILFSKIKEGVTRELHLLDLDDGYHADRIFSAAPQVVESLLFDFLTRVSRRAS